MELIRPVRGKHGGKQVEEEIPRNSIMEESGNEINLRGDSQKNERKQK